MVDLAYSIADQDVATTKSIGIYNFSVQLVRHLSRHPNLRNLTVFANSANLSDLDLATKTRVEQHNSAVRSKLGRVLWDQWGVYRGAKRSGHPWLFLPKGFCSFMAHPPVKVAACVHDIMGDYYSQHYPGCWPRIESDYFRRSLAATIRSARVIVTNTEFSKRELLGLVRRLGCAEPNVVVVGYGFEALENKKTEKEDRILLFASKWPHKRTDIAIRFLEHWQRKTNYAGVIDCIGILSRQMAKPGGNNWNWVGRVPPEQGRQMIRRARAVVYVSDYEGFGMPPVEAVLEGTCPVFSDIPPLREVMDDAGCPFSNESDESFVSAMTKALAMPREALLKWSAQLLQRHNWPAVTQKVMSELSKT